LQNIDVFRYGIGDLVGLGFSGGGPELGDDDWGSGE
jgi:hypothetical protein